MPPLLGRVLALVGLLLVPLSLAVASQALASRPGAPDVDPTPVRIDATTGPTPAPTTGPTTGPTPTPTSQPRPGPPSPTGPRLVFPSVPPADRDGDQDEDEDEDD